MLALARCSKRQRIIVAGSKSIELTSELCRRGYVHVAAAANCGRAARQYDLALVDWRRRMFKALETTLDGGFFDRRRLLVIWADPQKPAVRQDLCSRLEHRG
jgi:hypothetical protein